MSWQTFKDELRPYLENPTPGKGLNQFGKKLADAYDTAVKQGGDLLHRVPLQSGNKQALEFFSVLALVKGLLDTTGNFNLINELGKGIEMYWTGANLYQFPTPLIPAPGSTANIAVEQNLVANAGKWPKVPFVVPTNKVETFLNVFVLAATIHLLSVGGIIKTVSLYPPNGSPATGLLNWNIYLLKPPELFKDPELEGTYYISQNSQSEACRKQNLLEANTFPPKSSLGNIQAIDVSSYQGNLNNNNFFLSDGVGYREFKWVNFPRIAVPSSEEVQSCPIT
jgi:hypothetical protein